MKKKHCRFRLMSLRYRFCVVGVKGRITPTIESEGREVSFFFFLVSLCRFLCVHVENIQRDRINSRKKQGKMQQKPKMMQHLNTRSRKISGDLLTFSDVIAFLGFYRRFVVEFLKFVRRMFVVLLIVKCKKKLKEC